MNERVLKATPQARKKRVTMSLNAARLDRIKELVKRRKAASVSAYVDAALAASEEHSQLEDLLDEMDRKYGPPDAEADAWAREALGL